MLGCLFLLMYDFTTDLCSRDLCSQALVLKQHPAFYLSCLRDKMVMMMPAI